MTVLSHSVIINVNAYNADSDTGEFTLLNEFPHHNGLHVLL